MDEIKGIARVKFHPGKLDEWKRLTEQAMEIVRTRDPGTLQYEVFFNDDESEAIVFERYRRGRRVGAFCQHRSPHGTAHCHRERDGRSPRDPERDNASPARRRRTETLHPVDGRARVDNARPPLNAQSA